jgi:hypothetical protein
MEAVIGIDEKTGQPIIEELSAVPTFSFRNGYTLSGLDLGQRGVKLNLVRQCEDPRGIILPPEQARQFGSWLVGTVAAKPQSLPPDLADILRSILKQKGLRATLKKGDKARIRQALRILTEQAFVD